MSAERYVFDSYALLAYFEDENGADIVEELLGASREARAESWMSIINFGELLYITEREQGRHAAQRLVAAVDELPIEIVSADRSRTFAAAHVKAHHALSYADAFAVALASELEARVVTGDPEFEKAGDLVSILWIGRDGTND